MLFRGGRRDAELVLFVADAEGDGDEDIFDTPSSCAMSDIGVNRGLMAGFPTEIKSAYSL